MGRSIKLANNDYIDSSGVTHNRNLLSDILNKYYVLYKYVGNNGNANDYRNFGFYYFYQNCSNVPGNYFYCIVIGAGGDCIQMGMCVTNDNFYIRRYVNGVWNAWRTI